MNDKTTQSCSKTQFVVIVVKKKMQQFMMLKL